MVRTEHIVGSVLLYVQLYLFSIEIINACRVSKQKRVLHITATGHRLFPDLNVDTNKSDVVY